MLCFSEYVKLVFCSLYNLHKKQCALPKVNTERFYDILCKQTDF